jgi:hypothetical protein
MDDISGARQPAVLLFKRDECTSESPLLFPPDTAKIIFSAVTEKVKWVGV